MRRNTVDLHVALVIAALSLTRVSVADDLDRLVHATMIANGIPGLSLAVVVNGHVVKAAGYGLSVVEDRVPSRPNTVFEIASLSKQFTATAIVMLQEEGKLSVDDPVSKWLDGTPETWASMKISNLLNHTSGLQELVFDPSHLNSLSFLRYSRSQILRDVERSSLKFAPGSRMAYSNMGYELLALIVEKASGERFQKFLQDRIFTPVGMKDTRFVDPAAVVPHRAEGYTKRGAKLARWTIGESLGSLDVNGFGGIESSVEDLAAWEIALQKGLLLKPASWEQMWTPGKLNDGSVVADYDGPYGFGWHVNELPFGHVLEHTGYTGAAMLRLPAKKLAVIVLSNLGDGNPKPFGTDLGYPVGKLGRDLLALAAKRWK